jgi:hypothetical protein
MATRTPCNVTRISAHVIHVCNPNANLVNAVDARRSHTLSRLRPQGLTKRNYNRKKINSHHPCLTLVAAATALPPPVVAVAVAPPAAGSTHRNLSLRSTLAAEAAAPAAAPMVVGSTLRSAPPPRRSAPPRRLPRVASCALCAWRDPPFASRRPRAAWRTYQGSVIHPHQRVGQSAAVPAL